MIKRYVSLACGCLGLLLAFQSPAQADVLLSETWDGTTIQNGLTISGDPLDNLGMWIDFPDSNRWGVVSDADCVAPCSGSYARHLEQTSDNTNSLFYGIDRAVSAGETFAIDFDYIATRNGRVTLLGLQAGTSALDPFAPFWFNGDPDDGESLLSGTDEVLPQSAAWTSASRTATAGSSFDALGFVVVMGGIDGVRGIDNINVATVAEPPTLALLAMGVLGLLFAQRHRHAA
ncbi:MAG: hypothetical protein ACODAC_04015 [Pseudomonadota bacterium]